MSPNGLRLLKHNLRLQGSRCHYAYRTRVCQAQAVNGSEDDPTSGRSCTQTPWAWQVVRTRGSVIRVSNEALQPMEAINGGQSMLQTLISVVRLAKLPSQGRREKQDGNTNVKANQWPKAQQQGSPKTAHPTRERHRLSGSGKDPPSLLTPSCPRQCRQAFRGVRVAA